MRDNVWCFNLEGNRVNVAKSPQDFRKIHPCGQHISQDFVRLLLQCSNLCIFNGVIDFYFSFFLISITITPTVGMIKGCVL
jgi:hypothetical protein